MTVAHVEVLVEEPSMETALRSLLPKIVNDMSFEIYPHQGKEALLHRLPGRLQGYRKFLPDNWRVVVLVDRDADDCSELKERLEVITRDAGLRTRAASGPSFQVLTRIVVEALESWYFGDWTAVRKAYPKLPATLPAQANYRTPDAIRRPSEALERVMKRAGYFPGGLRKLEIARRIGPLMDPDRNTSRSFHVLRHALGAFTA